MMRLIDADALRETLEMRDYCMDCPSFTSQGFCANNKSPQEVCDAIDKASTVDAVEVVWCEDCRYWNDVHSTEKPSYCRLMDIFPTKDFYCKKGRRKDYDN